MMRACLGFIHICFCQMVIKDDVVTALINITLGQQRRLVLVRSVKR